MLIALVGLIGSGKDTVGRHLVESHGFKDIAFAGALKDALCAIFGWDRDMIEGKTPQSRAWRNEVDHWWAERLGIPHFTPRWAMQNVGTETLREHFHDKLWIFRVERDIDRMFEAVEDARRSLAQLQQRTGRAINYLGNLTDDPNVVVTDGRFPNELDMVRARGGKIIRVRRGPEPEWFSTADAANSDTFLHAPECYEAMLASGVHISEWAWVGYKFDAIIENDGSLDQLFERADTIIRESSK